MINNSEKRENIAALNLQVCVFVFAHVVDLTFSSRLPGKNFSLWGQDPCCCYYILEYLGRQGGGNPHNISNWKDDT